MGSCVGKWRTAVHPLPEIPHQHEASSTTFERREDTVRGESLSCDVNVIPSIPPESFYPKVVSIGREEEQCRVTRRKMVAKEAERPLRCLVEQTLNDWREGSVLGQIESHALSVPAECTTSVKTLASSLTDPQAKYYKSLCDHESASFHLQIAKAYAIYFWIANNIHFCKNTWESFLSNPEDFESKAKPREVLRKRKYFSIGHANLFHGVATAAGLTSRVVMGNLKVCRSLSSLPDYQHFEPSRLNAHWWNMFLIDGVWFPVDCICGAGMAAPYLHFQQKFTRYFFAVRPDNLILSHIPVEPEWQLIENIVTLYNLSLMISPSLPSFCLGIQPLSWAETMSTDPQNNTTSFKISLKAERNIQITAELRKVVTVHSREDQFQATYIERKDSNVVDVYATAPGKGHYFLDIHAHCNGESSMCLSYMINCATNPATYTGFPRVYRLPSVAFGFRLLYWNTPQEANICENNLGKMDLIFQCLPGLQFHHCLLSGKAASGKAASGLLPENGAHCYCTTITNDPNDHSLHKLSVIFPDKGWWTVYLSAARKSEDVEVSGYTTILNYRVFAQKHLSRCCYPHVQSSDVRFELSEPISCSGTDTLTVPFFSKKKLCLYSCLCYENLEGTKMPQYTLSQLLEDATTLNEYKYALYAVFPKPGRWYVQVFAHAFGQQTRTEYLSLFNMCVDVDGCMENAVFPLMIQEVTEKCNISLLPNNYLVTFCDTQDMFSFRFQAPKNTNFDHYIEPRDDDIISSDESAIHRYCTYLHVCEENDTRSIYELRAVFPTKGKWSVVICAGESLLSKPEEAIRIPLNISSTLESQVFPAIHPPLHEFGVRFSKDYPLYPRRPESPEFEFQFFSPKAIEYAWTLKDVQTQTQFQHSTNVYLETKGTGDTLMQKLRVVFPKPGVWLVQVVARTILTNVVADNSLSLSLHYQPVFDLIIEASNASLSQMAFPRVYEPFHSKFGLHIDSTDVPIPSYFRQLPAACTIKFYSPTGVVFWHMCKEFSQIKDKKITRMTSNPETGLHELYADISRRGQWTVYLYAKFANDTSKNWIAVLQHSITAKSTRTTSSSSLSSRVSPVPHLH